MTRCEPRTLVIACRIVSFVMPRCWRSRDADERPPSRGNRDEEVLGARVVVLETLGFLLGGGEDLPQAGGEADLRCRHGRAADG